MGVHRLVATGLLLLAAAAQADDPFLRRTTTVRVVEDLGPTVVTIATEQATRYRGGFGDPFFDRFFNDFFEPRMPNTQQNLGSGVIFDAAGHILTNEHVVARATRIRVALSDGREYDAELVGADPNNDLAVLKVLTDEKLPFVSPGTSDDLMVGEPVIAIGNPFGLSHTVTTGVISAVNRSIRTDSRVYHGFLQIDASINPGNSGGPLLNAAGDLIGINTAVYQHAQGIGFAIPIDVAKRVVSELIQHGEVSPVWLGLSFQDLDAGLIEALGLPEPTRGALVNKVVPDSPGGRGGVKQRDVVVRLDGQPIVSGRDFFERLEGVTNGQKLTLSVLRDNKARELKIAAEEIPEEVIARLLLELTGLVLERSDEGGYAVQSVVGGSGSARTGIQEGDRVLAINGLILEDSDDLRKAALALRGQARALLVVQRGSGRYHVAIPMV